MSAVSTPATENHGLHVYWPKFPRGKGPDNRFFASQRLQDRLVRIHRGRVEVLVDRPGKRVNLFLTSYAPTLWDIKACANVRLGRVIAVGIYEPVVKVVPEETDPNGCSSVNGRLLEASGPCTFALRGAVPNSRQAALKLAGTLL